MPVSGRIERGLVWLDSEGIWDFAAWKAAVDAFLADPEFRPGMGLVHDRRKLLLPGNVSATGAIELAVSFVQSRAAQIGKARWALVVADPENYGIGRMAQSKIHETEISLGVFYDLADAESWARGPTPSPDSSKPEDETR